MRLLINCINIILCSTFHTISLIYPKRDVYISSLIQPEQILYIQNSIAKMNLTRTYDKFKYPNIIRIQYDNSIIANTKMSANLYQIGSFIVENTVISFNPNIYENVLGCVILHELRHSQGLSSTKLRNICIWWIIAYFWWWWYCSYQYC